MKRAVKSSFFRTLILLILIIFLVTHPLTTFVFSESGDSFQLAINVKDTFATFAGILTNVVIQPDNSTSMRLVSNYRLQTARGTFPLNATGTLVGMRNGSSLSGLIQNLVGKACVLQCFDFDFVGDGQWSGTLNQGHAEGILQGKVIFVSSPMKEVPQGLPASFSGTWVADFQIPTPELSLPLTAYVLTFAVLTLLLNYSRRINGSLKISA